MLSFLVILTVSVSHQHGEMQQARYGMIRARQLAEMGIAVAAHPVIKVGDPLLRRSVSGVERFEVVLGTEESRLNLNALLTEQHLPVLERLLQSWGISAADAQGITATLMDWTDADDLKRRPDSAEKLDYEHLGFSDRPFNRKFSSLDEVDLVARADEIQSVKPDWRSFFTLRGTGQLDVNMASAEVLAAATGASLANANLLVQQRNGLDGLQQTEDDQPLKSLNEALSLLGITGQQGADILPLLTLQGATLRIESIGTAGDSRCGIAVIMNKNGGTPHITEWREFPLKGAQRL
jgi:type II secretory pathway component PulK